MRPAKRGIQRKDQHVRLGGARNPPMNENEDTHTLSPCLLPCLPLIALTVLGRTGDRARLRVICRSDPCWRSVLSLPKLPFVLTRSARVVGAQTQQICQCSFPTAKRGLSLLLSCYLFVYLEYVDGLSAHTCTSTAGESQTYLRKHRGRDLFLHLLPVPCYFYPVGSREQGC